MEQKMSENHHARPEGTGRHPAEDGLVHQAESAVQELFCSEVTGLMGQVVERKNMMAAWKRVKANGGAPGIDGMTIDELWPWLQLYWLQTKVALLEDRMLL